MNKPEHHIEEYQLIEYLSGKADKELIHEVNLWLQASDENAQYFGQVKKLWKNSADISVFENIDVDTNWMAVKTKADIRDRPKAGEINWYQSIWKVAAAILLLATFSYFIYQNAIIKDTEVITIAAKNDGRDQFNLPDGSTVWLNSGSQITYNADFGLKERKLTLVGEGFFEVAHNIEKPFIILLNDTETTVLGTSFNIKEDAAGKGISLVLVTGKVQLIKGNQRAILMPGEKVVTDTKGQLMKTRNDDPNFDAWKTRKLSFTERPVEEVIETLNAFYKVKIEIENSIFGTCPLTTTFENATLEEVLETLIVIFDVELTRQGQNQYTLSGVGCGDS